MIRIVSAALMMLSLCLSGCMTYRDFPKDYIGKAPAGKPYQKLSYKINPFEALSVGGAPDHIRETFRSRTPFQETEAVEQPPAKGIYCEVSIQPKAPGVMVLVGGYLSAQTLTLFPAWSTRDGYFIQYDVYVDGEKKKRYEYEVTRKAAVWAGLLPFIWVNALTYSEREVIDATSNKFFKDSEPLLQASQQAALQ